MNQIILIALEQLNNAYIHVGRCADSAWASSTNDIDPYRIANQELWIREWRLQEQIKTLDANDYQQVLTTSSVQTVNDTIPGSRLARIYATGRHYELEREMCYAPAYETTNHELNTAHPVNMGPLADNIECWQMPEVEMYFRELTKGHPEQDLFFSALIDSSISDITVEEHCKVTNMRDKDWICQTPWKTLLSERYPPMREFFETTALNKNNSLLSSVTLPDMASFPTPRYSASSLQELALQMKINSAEVRAIWNDTTEVNCKCLKRQRRTPRLPMEQSSVTNNKCLLNSDSNLDDSYTYYQENNNIQQDSIVHSIFRENVDFDDPRFNVFNEIDARKRIFFNKNTGIIDSKQLTTDKQSDSNKKRNVIKTILLKNEKCINNNNNNNNGNNERTLKILHAPQNTDATNNYVRNVPAVITQRYSLSDIQGIEFNPIFTPENRPNVEEKFARAPGAGRKKNHSEHKSDQKAVKLLEALTKMSQNVDCDQKSTKMYILSKNDKFNSESIHNDLNVIFNPIKRSSDNDDKKIKIVCTDQMNTKSIGSVDVPEFIPKLCLKEVPNLKVSSSLPNISETVDVPEFYPKEYLNVPKKAASVYDKPLNNIKMKLPENTSNTINTQQMVKIDEQSISYPRTVAPIGSARPRKQHSVQQKNFVFTTSTGKDPRKWLYKEYPNRLNEFDRVDNLINLFANFENTETKTEPIEIQYNPNRAINYPNVVQYQQLLTTQFPPINLQTVAMQNIINVLPGGTFVSTNTAPVTQLAHNLYINQNLLTTADATRNITLQAFHSLPCTSLTATNHHHQPASSNHSSNILTNVAHDYVAAPTPQMAAAHTVHVLPTNNTTTVRTVKLSQKSQHHLQQQSSSQTQSTIRPSNKIQLIPSTVKSNNCQGVKRRLYSAVLSNTNTTMESDCDELERQALEQYRPSEDSLKDFSDDSIQAKFQELERLAMEQYASSSSVSSDGCTLTNNTTLIVHDSNGQVMSRTASNVSASIVTSVLSNTNMKTVTITQSKSSIIRKSNSNLSMGSKKSTVVLPSIGEVDALKNIRTTKKQQSIVIQEKKRKISIVKPSSHKKQFQLLNCSEDDHLCNQSPEVVIVAPPVTQFEINDFDDEIVDKHNSNTRANESGGVKTSPVSAGPINKEQQQPNTSKEVGYKASNKKQKGRKSKKTTQGS